MWLETWDNLHTLDARRLIYCGLNILIWEFSKVVPICWIAQAFYSISMSIWVVKIFFWGIKHIIILVDPYNCYNIFIPIFSLNIYSSSIFQDPNDNSHLKPNFSKKVPQPTLSKTFSNQYFQSLEKLGFEGMLNKPFPTLRGSCQGCLSAHSTYTLVENYSTMIVNLDMQRSHTVCVNSHWG